MDFDRIRCFNDTETIEAFARMVNYPEFIPIFSKVFPNLSSDELKALLLSVKGAYDFQLRVVDLAVRKVIETTMDEFLWDGIQNLSLNDAYLFIANHRDIVLDAALLQHLLVLHQGNTTQITFGNNLMTSPFVVDFGKANKMFTVFRDSDLREQLRDSQELSAYIRHVIEHKRESIWIAQRSGRTKNGIDATQRSVLRMLSMSGHGSLTDRLASLNIVPLTISYEFEPCAQFKVNEVCLSRQQQYIKGEGEDYNSIIEGIQGYKGRVKLCIGKPITQFIHSLPDTGNKNEQLRAVINEIDRQIYTNYQLWPNNYIAHDLLYNQANYHAHYTHAEKEKFIAYMNQQIAPLKSPLAQTQTAFLELYANPLKTKNEYLHQL